MEKRIVYDQIFMQHYEGSERDIIFGDLPKNLEDSDIIEIIRGEGFYSENESWDAFTSLIIKRPRLENDEEFAESQKKWDEKMVELKAKRHQNYLRLKKEFGENEEVLKIFQMYKFKIK